MPSMRDLLERLRPSGAPGTAAPSAVPADRQAERSAELDPVLARLDDVQAEAEGIRTAARSEASRRRDAAREQARAIVEEARRTAEAERRDAASIAEATGAADSRERRLEADLEADRITRVAAVRSAALLDRVMDAARREIAEIAGTGAGVPHA